MIRATTFAGRNVAVFGLGSSGNATAQSLLAGGASVSAWDDTAVSREAARAVGIPIVDLSTADWRGFSTLVLAPGVPLTHPVPHWTVEKARAAGVEIIGDVEIFARERAVQAPDAPFIAITGTNGKSTTTALIAHILREAGKNVQMGGNIGKPILTLEAPHRDRFHVVEMSSFQIDLTPTLHPSVGVLLNITPDHIDRHGTLENYATVKERLVTGADKAVVGIDDEHARAIADCRSDVVRISSAAVADIRYADGLLWRGGHAVADLGGVATLRGAHNGQNAAAAFAALSLAGLDDAIIARHLHSYPGLPHRLEQVAERAGILFVNDSKATNADSTEKALGSFDEPIYWILGGRAKEGGIAALARFFPNIAKAYLIGEASEDFARALEGKIDFERSGTLDRAVTQAAADALADNRPGSVVLLSPACASYDQFKNFEVRGDAFRNLVSAYLATRDGR